ncbi:hypothetical protein [uncultured Thiodictyon sp.]|uniref:hypothetical protein n=1 Tax=uncultured Thiodictyon sp. TaxID=1846217 RepID=UPI0025F33B9A|nr:hypothetical protein [uncultured Thiodictyon sp.]
MKPRPALGQIARTGCLVGALVIGAVLPAAPRADGQPAAQGWLQLERDRRDARRQAEPMTPQESQRLQIREWQESMQLRQTLQGQRRDLDLLEQSRRQDSQWSSPLSPVPPPMGPDARTFGQEMLNGQALDSLRLRQDMQRLIEGTPPGR